jgi:cell wall assembly regulator SMI1
MEESKRLITSWVRIKHWLSENFPETLENLYSPAFDSQIEAAEATIGLRFPDALKALLLEHNGEDHHWPPGIFPDGHRFLPTEDIVETWYQLKEFNDATPENWLPISTSRSKAIRFLDFNPPQGGNVGQVVQVDFNQQSYDVLADSFVDYIEMYAMDLGVNKYAVIGDDILLNNDLLNNEMLNDDFANDELSNEEMLNEALLNDDMFDGDILDIELSDPDLEDIELSNPAMSDTDIANFDVHHAVQSEINSENNSEYNSAVDIDIESPVQLSVEREVQSAIKRAAQNVQHEVQDDLQEDVQHDVETITEPEVPVLQSAVQPIAKEPAKQSIKPSVKQPAKQRAKASAKPPVKEKVKATAPTPAKPAVQHARKDTEPTPAKAQESAAKHALDRFESGERLIIVGEMASLMGKEEMLFTVETEHAKEYTFLAKASFTKGFSDIALDQYVRILAKKFHGEIKSHFIEQGLANQPEYVAFDYVVLPVEKPSANKVSLPPPENIDQIAHSILQSIKANFKRGADYKEVTPAQSAHLSSKFYIDSTERLLKLGFHYTADLEDRVKVKGAHALPPFFRVMSFFDDGIVASFYHIKPKITWPFHASRKVIEFETELSDGNIIVSTTAEDEIEYPLPKTISRYVHPGIPLEGLLHKHRSKIRRYQTHKPEAAIVKVRSKKEFIALRQRRQQMIYNHLKSVGWVTKEYVAKHFNNKEVAEQVYARIKQFAGTNNVNV